MPERMASPVDTRKLALAKRVAKLVKHNVRSDNIDKLQGVHKRIVKPADKLFPFYQGDEVSALALLRSVARVALWVLLIDRGQN